MQQTVDRRALLIGGGAATLVIPFAVTFMGGAKPGLAGTGGKKGSGPGTQLGAYIAIDTSNNVTVFIGSTEMGQGIMTGMGQLVAEELMLNWSQVSVQHAPASSANPNPYANPLFYAQVTGGSTSMRGWYLPMRQAAAIAAQMLLSAANILTPTGGWSLAIGGKATNGTTTYLFKDLVATAAGLTPPKTAPLATTNRIIGQRMPRTDAPAKVNGSAVFGIDVQVPGMLFASVAHCPTLGGTVATMGSKPAGAIAAVNLGNAVAVVANDTWTAMNLANGLASKTTWTLPTNLAALDSASITATGLNLVTSTTVTPQVLETTGSTDAGAAVAGAKTKIDQTYQLPFIPHACMEVVNCTASVTATSCEVWAPTQAQQFCIPTIQAITGLPTSAITVHTTYLGGGLGRKIEQDYIAHAVTVSKAVGKPVKLIWSRTQDFQNDKYRPCAAIRVQAGLDSGNNYVGLLYRNVSPSISVQNSGNPEDTGAVSGAVGMPYNIINRRIEFVPNPAQIPLGYWRSVGESYNTFAVESSIDELAFAANIDPMAFRKSLLANDVRSLGVLNAVDTLSGWSTSAPPAGTARGLAFLQGFGSYIAVVALISQSKAGQISIKQLYCAIDCGLAVNPDSIEAQLQSGLNHGVTSALWGQITFASGVPNVRNFSNFKLMRYNEAPQISTAIVPSTQAPGGIGETGVPCVAPALANAYAKLTGTRVRTLPFYPGMGMSDF